MRSFEERKKICLDKKPFPSEASALADSTLNRCGRRRLFAYHCPECRAWHLTKSKPREA